MKKYNITKEFLIKEYIEKKKSAPKIAEEIGCNINVIYNRLNTYNITIRNRAESNKLRNKTKRIFKILTKEFLEKEYILNKKSTITISKEIHCTHATIENYLHKYNIKMRTNKEAHIGKLNFMYGKRFFGKDNPNWQNGGEINKIYHCKKCGKKVTYVSNRGLGMCKSCSHKGKLNFRFSKPSPHSKGDYYKNIWMRSSYEIAYAKYLDKNNIKWQYEPKRFYFEDCSYLPDFYLPKTNEYIEIKGWWRDSGRKRFDLFKLNYPNKKIEVLMKPELQKLGVKI